MQELVIIYLISLTCLLGAWFARMDGGAPPKVNEWIERFLCMSFYLCACVIANESWWALISLIGTFGIATGHGQYFLNLVIKAISPERVDFIVSLFFGKDPRTHEKYRYMRNISHDDLSPQVKETIKTEMEDYGLKKLYFRGLSGMSIHGLMLGLPSYLYVAYHGFALTGLLLLLPMIWKPLSYAVGNFGFVRNWMTNIEHLEWGTEIAEALYGFLRTFSAILFIILIWKNAFFI